MDCIFRSDVLGLNYKIKRNNSGAPRVVFEDQVNYTLPEVELLEGKPDEQIVSAHLLKRVFKGEIVETK